MPYFYGGKHKPEIFWQKIIESNLSIAQVPVYIERWEWKRSKCFFIFIHSDHFALTSRYVHKFCKVLKVDVLLLLKYHQDYKHSPGFNSLQWKTYTLYMYNKLFEISIPSKKHFQMKLLTNATINYTFVLLYIPR